MSYDAENLAGGRNGVGVKSDLSIEVLKGILSTIDEGIHVVDTKGTTIFYNEVASRHDGMEVDEVLGKPLLSVFPSLTEHTSTLLKVLKTKKGIYNQEQTYTNVHGKTITTLNSTLPIFVNGEIVGAMEIAKDYSNVKSLTEQLIELQKKLRPTKEKDKSYRSNGYTLANFLTVNPKMNQIKMEALKLAHSRSPILVYGESGTGKEVFVQGIHYASNRKNGPFVPQNCAAIPETLLESILFGTTKGSYTGAVDRPGLFELADSGTLFLDELHAMPFDLQAKLLRVLEDGQIRRVGSTKNISVNVRVIAAMNVHPDVALQENIIRKDLFYRLNVFTFELLPLRERKEDILFLANRFIDHFNKQLNKNVHGMEKEVETLFLAHSWPGNVRELKHTIEYMMNVCEGSRLKKENLPMLLKNNKEWINYDEDRSLKEKMEQFEKSLIQDALKHSEGNIAQAAKRLKIPRQTLQYKIKKFKL